MDVNDGGADPLSAEELYYMAQIVDRANITMWAASGFDDDYRVKFWSKGAERVYGYTRREAIGSPFVGLLIDPSNREESLTAHARILDGGEYEWGRLFSDRGSDGSVRDVLTNSFRIRGPGDTWLVAEVGIDITEIRKVDKAARRLLEEVNNRSAIDAIKEICFSVARLETSHTLNAAIDRILALATEGIPGTPVCCCVVGNSETGMQFFGPHYPFADIDELAMLTHLGIGDTLGGCHFSDSNTHLAANVADVFGVHALKEALFLVAPLHDFADPESHSETAVEARTVASIGLCWPRIRLTQQQRSQTQNFLSLIELLVTMVLGVQREQEAQVRLIQERARTLVIESVQHNIGNVVFRLEAGLNELAGALQDEQQSRALVEGLETDVRDLQTLIRSLPEEIAASGNAVPVDLVRIATTVANSVRAKYKDVDFKIVGDRMLHGSGPVVIVRRAIEQVLTNAAQILTDVDGGGAVEVEVVSIDEDWVAVRIEDDGPGVDPEVVDTMFRDRVGLRRGGSGRGLFLARHTLDKWEGAIDYLGSSRFGGAAFEVRLRRAR